MSNLLYRFKVQNIPSLKKKGGGAACIILSLLTCLVLVLLKRYSNPETIARTQKQTASNPPPELIQGPGNGEEIGRKVVL